MFRKSNRRKSNRRESNLRELIDSINKEDFDYFKCLISRITDETEAIMKVYEKFLGHQFPENRDTVTIVIGDTDYQYNDKVYRRHVDIRESYLDDIGLPVSITTEIEREVNDPDIWEVVRRYGRRLEYRRYDRDTSIINSYIDYKASKYNVSLDSNTFHKLREFVEVSIEA